ncbi:MULTISPECIES: type VII secretion protein EccE [unclassified Rhodococcus (in: high G+C Gram-positive bacteria)]|uniref:type VII secretion protein EccE n=1 Tax=unclassified Rhodococcus (in: high G+C Gram-positive bacteria) TaxID=192944 RepID=UPI00339A3FC9
MSARSSLYFVSLRIPRIGRLVGLETVLAVGVAIAVAFDASLAVIVSVAAPATAVPFLVIAGRPVLDWATTGSRYASRTTSNPGVTRDYSEDDGRAAGIHWRGGTVSCVLELHPPSAAMTRLGRAEASTDTGLDLSALAECLSQHDISVSSIDIVAHGMRTASGTPATDVYERLIGPLPAVATRTVWVTVTLEISHNRAAIDARGGGLLGASRAVWVASERVARALEAKGISSRMLVRSEIQSTASHMCRGVAANRLTENWGSAPLPGVIDTGFGFDCRKIDTAVLTELWAIPSLSTTIAFRLTPGSNSSRVRISGACRFVNRGATPRPHIPGAVSMNGRHREALIASLPLAIFARGHAEPIRDLPYGIVERLNLPTSGCGQLLGSDTAGHGVAARVHGRGIDTVLVAGELYLAQQLVFRALSTGARVLIRSDRPHAWGPLVDSIATPDRLLIDGGPPRGTGGFDVLVQDFADAVVVPARSRPDGTTVMTVTERPPREPMSDPDLSIVQPGAAGDRIMVRAGRNETELMLVTISQETAFIGRPRSVRRPADLTQPGYGNALD